MYTYDQLKQINFLASYKKAVREGYTHDFALTQAINNVDDIEEAISFIAEGTEEIDPGTNITSTGEVVNDEV